jgi:LemA protein
MEWLVLLGVVAVAALIVIGIYNRLVALRQNRGRAFSDIDVQLKQRLDLVPSLVETVKGYAGHEKELFERVTAARAGVQKAGNEGERLAAETVLGRVMTGFYAVAENYPALKADQNFQRLMAELSDLENKIAAARRFFNNATSEYNTTVQQFPANLIAAQFGFKEEAFFEVDETERAVLEKPPEVKFGS